MTRQERFRQSFVEFIPDELEEGAIYVSLPHANHLCACGCRREVITPISPTDWQLTFDGETISLKPSIGNWSFPCQSHYWIERGRVRWQIEAGRAMDRRNKKRWAAGLSTEQVEKQTVAEPPPPIGFMRRLFRKFRV